MSDPTKRSDPEPPSEPSESTAGLDAGSEGGLSPTSVGRGLWRLNSRLRERGLFALERFLLRGAGSRLLVVVAAVGLFSLVGGVLVRVADSSFTSTGDAVWWAFLRLTDPGYLGDDEGFWRALISTVLTVAGYVIFLGALVAILTQWLNKTLAELEMGLRPISMDGHVVILGWGQRTVRVIEGLVLAGTRGEQWLEQRQQRRLRVATLVDRLTPAHLQDLRDRLGGEFDPREHILRSGSPLKLDHLRRVDIGHAAAVVVPANAREDATTEASSDARVIKTALSLNAHVDLARLPILVVEIGDERKIAAARGVYRGRLAAIPSDRLIAAVLARSLATPGVARLVADLLAPGGGASIYIRRHPALVGERLGAVRGRFERAALLGLLPPGIDGLGSSGVDAATLILDDRRVLGADDALVLVAPEYDDTEPTAGQAPELSGAVDTAPEGDGSTVDHARPRSRKRVVVLGWNRLGPELLEELAEESDAPGEVTVVSRIDPAQRESDLEEHGFDPGSLEVRHVVASVTRMSTLRRLGVAGADGIVVLASDWHTTGEQADAHSLTTVVLLRRLLDEAGLATPPPVVVELTDDDNARLLAGPGLDAVTGSVLVSHALAQAVLNPAFASLIQALLSSATDRGFGLRPALELASAGSHRFELLQAACRRRGLVAVGLLGEGRGDAFRVPARGEPVRVDAACRVVVFG